MNRKTIARHRFGITLTLVFAVQILFVVAIFLSLALDTTEAQRAWLREMLLQRSGLWVALATLLLFALGFGLKALFNAYLTPIARLAEDAVLLATNPGRRITPQGARDVRVLIEKLNALAAAYETLHDDVQEKIETANRALTEEKNRLAALMTELALSVLVCNVEGRILLYNTRSRQLIETGVEGNFAAGIATIGLGRSVFGVIERGLILHALEQIQQRLMHQAGDVAPPVCAFVTTLAGGRIVRAHMAPVLDSAHTLNGFVLTLEDITRNVEADNRRDALVQSLTQDARATLANIRAAVEAIQTFPDMSAAQQKQFTGIIDDESKRLVCQIDRAAYQRDNDLDGQRDLEDMRGADLIALLLRRIGSPSLRVVTGNTIDPTLWLRVDSYTLTQALAYLAQRLANEAGVTELTFSLHRADRLANLDVTWSGMPLAADTLRVWESAALQTSPADEALTLNAVVSHHGGESVYRPESSLGAARYRLMLRASESRLALDIPPMRPGRPEYYDFDLFHQPGQNAEIDQCLLSQLSYTVFDTETTGLQPAAGDEIISIGALRIVNGRLLQHESFDRLIQPRGMVSAESVDIHGITPAMLKDQPKIEIVLPQFHDFAAETVLVAHNAAFDMRFLQLLEAKTGVAFAQPVLDTLLLSQVIHPNQDKHTLEAIAARLGVPIVGRHTALGDAIVTGEVFLKMIPLLAEKGLFTLEDARDAARQTLYARIRY